MSAEIIRIERFMDTPQFAVESDVSSLLGNIDRLTELQRKDPAIMTAEYDALHEAAWKLNSLVFKIQLNQTLKDQPQEEFLCRQKSQNQTARSYSPLLRMLSRWGVL